MAVFRGELSSLLDVERDQVRLEQLSRHEFQERRWGEVPGEWPPQRWAWLPPQSTCFCSSVLSQACSHCPLGYSSPINPGTFYPLLCPCLVCSEVRVETDAHSRAEQCGLSWNGCLKGTGSAVLFMQTGFSDPEEDWHTAGYLLENKDSPIRTNGQGTL